MRLTAFVRLLTVSTGLGVSLGKRLALTLGDSSRLVAIEVSGIAIACHLEGSERGLMLGLSADLVRQWPVEARGVVWLRSNLDIILSKFKTIKVGIISKFGRIECQRSGLEQEGGNESLSPPARLISSLLLTIP